jgi:hypothetical protein
MKKAFVFFIVGVVFFGACSAQNANAQNANIAQRIIGTWVDHRGATWVFNANGNLTKNSVVEHKFGVTETSLAIAQIYEGGIIDTIETYNISISSDGKTLILVEVGGSGYRSTHWLTKK